MRAIVAVVVMSSLGIASACVEQAAQTADAGVGPPIFEVDPSGHNRFRTSGSWAP